jgi:hypothetical protein
LLSQLAGIDRQIATPPQTLTAADIAATRARTISLLDTGDLETIQRVIRGIINRVVIDRSDKTVSGEITYFAPESTLQDVSISSASLGALSHSYIFTAHFTARIRDQRKRPT